jgi:hypothetical protein
VRATLADGNALGTPEAAAKPVHHMRAKKEARLAAEAAATAAEEEEEAKEAEVAEVEVEGRRAVEKRSSGVAKVKNRDPEAEPAVC